MTSEDGGGCRGGGLGVAVEEMSGHKVTLLPASQPWGSGGLQGPLICILGLQGLLAADRNCRYLRASFLDLVLFYIKQTYSLHSTETRMLAVHKMQVLDHKIYLS